MAATEVGTCSCPVCKHAGATVKRGEKGKHQINCDHCCTLIRTISREGDACIVAMMDKAGPAVSDQAAPAAAESHKEQPAAPVAKKKRGAFGDAIAALAGDD